MLFLVFAGDVVIVTSVSAWKGDIGDAADADGTPPPHAGDCSSGVLTFLSGPRRTLSTSLSGVSGAFSKLHSWVRMLVFTIGWPGLGD